jgi:hypothetical protein
LALASFVVLCAAQTRSVAHTVPATCHSGLKPKQVVELLFGRDIGRRLGVTESDWQRFVAREMSPRFPDGLTITDALGQWRDRASGAVVREPSKHVEIVLPGKPDDDARIDAIISAYKRDFHQQSVGVIERGACVSFKMPLLGSAARNSAPHPGDRY